jgi:hypothetical protein
MSVTTGSPRGRPLPGGDCSVPIDLADGDNVFARPSDESSRPVSGKVAQDRLRSHTILLPQPAGFILQALVHPEVSRRGRTHGFLHGRIELLASPDLAVSGDFDEDQVNKLFVSPLKPVRDPTGPNRETRGRGGGHREWWQRRIGQTPSGWHQLHLRRRTRREDETHVLALNGGLRNTVIKSPLRCGNEAFCSTSSIPCFLTV